MKKAKYKKPFILLLGPLKQITKMPKNLNGADSTNTKKHDPSQNTLISGIWK